MRRSKDDLLFNTAALAPLGLLNDTARHAVDFRLSTEDLPDPNNRVSSGGDLSVRH
jgi:hypothetical protein